MAAQYRVHRDGFVDDLAGGIKPACAFSLCSHSRIELFRRSTVYLPEMFIDRLSQGAAFFLALFFLAVGPGCASANRPASPRLISLPKIPVEGVDYSHGISMGQANTVAWAYFHRHFGLCGVPEGILSDGNYWMYELYVGFGGTYRGRLWIAKDGSEVLFQRCPKNRVEFDPPDDWDGGDKPSASSIRPDHVSPN